MGTGFNLPEDRTIPYPAIQAAGKKCTGITTASVAIVDILPGIVHMKLVIAHVCDLHPDFFLFIRIGFPRGPINRATVAGKPTE